MPDSPAVRFVGWVARHPPSDGCRKQRWWAEPPKSIGHWQYDVGLDMLLHGTPMTKVSLIHTSLADRHLWSRKQAGLTQLQLSRQSGVSQGAISDIETGRTSAGYGSTLLALAAALKVDLNWLQCGEGKPFATSHLDDRATLHALVDQLSPEQVTIAKGLIRVILSA